MNNPTVSTLVKNDNIFSVIKANGNVYICDGRYNNENIIISKNGEIRLIDNMNCETNNGDRVKLKTMDNRSVIIRPNILTFYHRIIATNDKVITMLNDEIYKLPKTSVKKIGKRDNIKLDGHYTNILPTNPFIIEGMEDFDFLKDELIK